MLSPRDPVIGGMVRTSGRMVAGGMRTDRRWSESAIPRIGKPRLRRIGAPPPVVPRMFLDHQIGGTWNGIAVLCPFVSGDEADRLTELEGQSVRLHLDGPLPDSDPFTVYLVPPYGGWSGSEIVINNTSTLTSGVHTWPTDWIVEGAAYWFRLGEGGDQARRDAWIAALGYTAIGSVQPA